MEENNRISNGKVWGLGSEELKEKIRRLLCSESGWLIGFKMIESIQKEIGERMKRVVQIKEKKRILSNGEGPIIFIFACFSSPFAFQQSKPLVNFVEEMTVLRRRELCWDNRLLGVEVDTSKFFEEKRAEKSIEGKADPKTKKL